MRRYRRREPDGPEFRKRGAAVVLLACGLAMAPMPAAASDMLRLAYQVAWGNVTLADGEVTYRQTGDRYQLISRGRTRGLLEFLFPWHGRAETESLFAAEGRSPLHHEHQGVTEEETRWTRVEWLSAPAPQTETRPPPDLEIVTPVAPETSAGTRDPLTVMLSLLDQLGRTGRCDAEAKIWDGRRRYDLTVTHIGAETLSADRPWAYEGPAVACALSFERIGGFWREAPDWRDPDEEAPTRRVVWAAETEPGRWVLVRAELETLYGTIVGRLLPLSMLERDPDEQALTE